MIIVIDSREQKPYKFKKYETIVKKLDVGDYSIEGYEDKFAIERKSFDDFVLSISKLRKAFEIRLKEASKLDYFALLIEIDMRNVWTRRIHSKMNKKTIVNTMIKWSVKYNLPIFLGGNRTQSKYIVQSLCEAWMKYHE